jgi:hypothetical protein
MGPQSKLARAEACAHLLAGGAPADWPPEGLLAVPGTVWAPVLVAGAGAGVEVLVAAVPPVPPLAEPAAPVPGRPLPPVAAPGALGAGTPAGAVAAGGAVAAAGVRRVELLAVPDPESPASFTSAAAMTASESAASSARTITGARQLGDAARRVRAAAPQRRHQSCLRSSAPPHSGQTSMPGAPGNACRPADPVC